MLHIINYLHQSVPALLLASKKEAVVHQASG